MAVERVWVRGYRSMVDTTLELGQLTVVQGENAAGKTNLYRALLILGRGAVGQLASTVLEEGGMPSMLWAGEPPHSGPKRKPTRVTLGAQVNGLAYELNLGLPSIKPQTTQFFLDADIKEEQAWIGQRTRRSLLLDRAGTTASAMTADQSWTTLTTVLDRGETALSQLGDPANLPELFALRARLSRWRFYHQFPSGPGAPARQPQPGVRTPVLADDGRDLAAAISTIREAGRGELVDELLAGAFPGSDVEIKAKAGIFTLLLHLPGLRRPLTAPELSDCTLRFLCLLAALLSPRPPELLVLNEPETSLNNDVLGPLATLIGVASEQTQVLVTTHADQLAEALVARHAAHLVRLRRDEAGRTICE